MLTLCVPARSSLSHSKLASEHIVAMDSSHAKLDNYPHVCVRCSGTEQPTHVHLCWVESHDDMHT